MSDTLAVAVILAAALGSIGHVGNSLAESRRGGGIVWLRWLRNAGVIVVWPLIVLWALVEPSRVSARRGRAPAARTPASRRRG